MSRLHLRAPSPALAISLAALFAALGGGAYAASTSDKKSDTKIAKKAAKSYFNGHIGGASVSHASTASSATTATNANTATNATQLGGKSASAYAQATPLTFTAPTFQNGWTTGAGFGAPGFAKDQFGIVHLTGGVRNASASSAVIFTLPAGDRPAADVDVATAFSAVATGVLRINPDGTVQPESGVTNFVDLDGITFVAGG